jgi:hypothetical protein
LRRSALFILVSLAAAAPAAAKPPAPGVFCETYPDAPVCASGLPDCATCHMGPPVRNAFGAAVEAELLPGEPRPLSDATFAGGLPDALRAVEGDDVDGDGFSNLDEILAGTAPADPQSNPGDIACPENDFYNLCDYDHAFAFKRVSLDVCGHSPTFEEMESFRAMSIEAREAAIDGKLAECVKTPFWRGEDGVLWNLANRKVRPVGALQSGPEPGTVPLADYEHDYNLFVWSQTDGRDAREAITADYFVVRDPDQSLRPVTEAEEASLFVAGDQELVPRERRAGLLTTRWNLLYFEMVAILPRAAAAQARRAWLRQDWARMEGLSPVPGQPFDYDNAGVDAPACAVCHSTIDAEAQAWRNYAGFVGGLATYVPDRMNIFEPFFPGIGDMGAGTFDGEPVGEVIDWARAAVASDQFARATILDYWQIMVGGDPAGFEIDELDALWQRFKGENGYSVEAMLRELVRTRAYGEP